MLGVNKRDLTDRELKKHFDEWLKPQWAKATPGLCFEVYEQGQLTASYQGGEVFPCYDLASLTKVLFTVPAMMLAYRDGKWQESTKVREILPWWPHEQTKVIDILTHSAGLTWWKPLYNDFIAFSERPARWGCLQEEIRQSPRSEDPHSVYSDIGFMSLAFLLESFYQDHLEGVWKKVKEEFAPESRLHWNPTPLQPQLPPWVERMQCSQKDYAPTEDCPWRGRRLQGEVHDENAWALGGLSTHAGLFGAASDAAQVFLRMRKAYDDKTDSLHSAVRWFVDRKRPRELGDWAAGFMMPTTGTSSSGQYFSPRSVGHTGFTGTSIWWDLDIDRLVVILSHRVYLGRERNEFAKLRPLLHDEIITQLKRISSNI